MNLKTGVMMLKIQLYHQRKKITFLNILKQKTAYIVLLFQNIKFLKVFDQINAAMVSIRDLFQKPYDTKPLSNSVIIRKPRLFST